MHNRLAVTATVPPTAMPMGDGSPAGVAFQVSVSCATKMH
jgi:hypothetical protein